MRSPRSIEDRTMEKTNTGNFFEDFKLGQKLAHATPRTLSHGDQALYTALYGSRFALQSSDTFAQSVGLPRAPLDDLLVFHTVFGKTVPDISLTPNIIGGGGAKVLAARQFVTMFNSTLQAEIPIYATLLGINLKLLDINPLFTELVHNPTAFGFTNSVGAAYDSKTGTIVSHPDRYVFWDGFHPTTPVHYLTGQLIYQNAAAFAGSSQEHLSVLP